MINTWWRVGMTIPMTEEEIETLKRGKFAECKKIFEEKIANREAKLDGDTYMPDECFEDMCDSYNIEWDEHMTGTCFSF